MKLSFLTSLFTLLGLSDSRTNCYKNCPSRENVIWALGDGCQVFRNECYFRRANCVRKIPLTITNRKMCQKQCPEVCPFVYQPTSGSYKGRVIHFDNDCYKAVHTCLTGETFL